MTIQDFRYPPPALLSFPEQGPTRHIALFYNRVVFNLNCITNDVITYGFITFEASFRQLKFRASILGHPRVARVPCYKINFDQQEPTLEANLTTINKSQRK